MKQVRAKEQIEGRNPVLEALKAGIPLRKIIVAGGARGKEMPILTELAGKRKIPVEYQERKILDNLSVTGKHQGVIAFGASPVFCSLDDLFIAAKTRNEPPLFLLPAGVEDPRNLGSMIRTAEAAGAHGIIIPQRRAAGFSPVAIRASAGAAYHLPAVEVKNTVRTMEELKKKGCWLVGADMAGISLWEEKFDLNAPVCLVLGGEGRGLGRLVRETCDLVVGIPLKGRVGSLNVSVAAGILLFEVMRRRAKQNSPSTCHPE